MGVKAKRWCALLPLAVLSPLLLLWPQTRRPPLAPGPTVEVPPFTVAVTLSPAAEKRLHALGESVKVLAYFDGDPLIGPKQFNRPEPEIHLGSAEKLVDEKNVAAFTDARISLSAWNRLADKNYRVTLNTVSARRVAPDNLLECPASVTSIETLKGRTVEVPCTLIGEPESSGR
jgi:hypothetical protein